MTERRGDQGFSVAPQRIGGPGRGGPGGMRRRGLGLALVIAAAAAIFVISWLGPRLDQRPSFDISFFATPTPTAIPSATENATEPPSDAVIATPLPAVTRPDGPVPHGTVTIANGDLQVIDLASGQRTSGPRAIPGRDAFFRTPDGDGWTCVCFDDGEIGGQDGRAVLITHADAAGALVDSRSLALFPRTASETGQSDVFTDVDVFGGGHRGLLAVATRDGGPYRISVASIDIDGRTMEPIVPVGNVKGPVVAPSPSPGEEGVIQDFYLDGPHVRVAPDGRTAFVWAMFQQFSSDGEPTNETRAWRVALAADGSVGAVSVAKGLQDLPMFCSSVGFAAADRLAWLCPSFSDDPAVGFDGTWVLGTVDLHGDAAGKNLIPRAGVDSYLDVLFDRGNGQVYAWDPGELTMSRFDAHTLVSTSTRFDPLVQSAPGLEPGGGTRPVSWSLGGSAVQGAYGTVTGSLDASRIYALGFDRFADSDTGNQPSLGVFVIDRSTLALLDRWAPVADYVGLADLPGGYVAATGLPGVNEDGHSAPWEASLTVHDATDGRVLVRFGQLGTDSPAFIVGP
jgi:hypothetical protein